MFDAQYMRKRNYLAWRAPIVCGAINRVLSPQSVLDLGCATGDLVKEFNKMGIFSMGVDSSECAKNLGCSEDIITGDFTDRQFWKEHSRWEFDLITCFEVFRFIDIEDLPFVIETIHERGDRFLFGYLGEKLPLIQTLLAGFHFQRIPEIEHTLQIELAPWRSKPAIKAIHNGLQYWVVK